MFTCFFLFRKNLVFLVQFGFDVGLSRSNGCLFVMSIKEELSQHSWRLSHRFFALLLAQIGQFRWPGENRKWGEVREIGICVRCYQNGMLLDPTPFNRSTVGILLCFSFEKISGWQGVEKLRLKASREIEGAQKLAQWVSLLTFQDAWLW